MIESLYDHVGVIQLQTPLDIASVTGVTTRYSGSIAVANVKNLLVFVKRYGTAQDLFSTLKLQFSTAAATEGTTAPTGATDITGAAFTTAELAVAGVFDAATGDASILMFDLDLEAASQQTTTLNASTYTHVNLAANLVADNGTNTFYAMAITGPQRYGHKGLSFTTASSHTLHVKKIG